MKFAEEFSEKSEWRIKPIRYRDAHAMMKTNWGALFGAMLFIGGIFAGMKVNVLYLISVLGLVTGLISIFFRGRIERRNWKKVVGQCKDKEWKSVYGTPGHRGGSKKVWTFQLLCEFKMDGRKYTVTPD